MKAKQTIAPVRGHAAARRRAGTSSKTTARTVAKRRRSTDPLPGWNTNAMPFFVNARPPAVTSRLAEELDSPMYSANAALIGVLSAQFAEPNMMWAVRKAYDYGYAMDREGRRRRKMKHGQ